MKQLKTLLAFLLAAVLLAGFGFSAAADGPGSAEEATASESAPPEPDAEQDTPASPPDWEEVVQTVLSENNVYEANVSFGYLNLVTGEEHYFNGDDYMIAASMFKLPLCMYYTELLETGQVTWDDEKEGCTYKYVQDSILLYSDNREAERLWEKLGGYAAFRSLTASYMGVEPAEITGLIQQYNQYTARQFITCLKLLYDENGRFPEIVETMKQAMPDRYFRLNENRYEIAHKFGYNNASIVGEETVTNDCGIVFAPQPFAIVCFTRNMKNGEDFLAAYCSAMCDYNEAAAAVGTAPEVEVNTGVTAAPESPVQEPDATAAPAEDAVSPLTPLIARMSSALPEMPGDLPLVPLGFVVLFLLLGIIAILRLCFRFKARFFTLLISLLISAAAMLLSIAGTYNGTIYAKPSGDPAQTVSLFFEAICAGRYEDACRQLRDYSDLGLGDTPSTEAGRMLCNALHASYSFELVGEPEIKMLDATQKVLFRYLRLPSIEADVEAETQRQIEAIVESSNPGDVYDEDRHYLPEVAERAYLAALEAVLAHAEEYYTEDELALSLTYTDGRWQMLMSPELLRALSGGTGA